MMYAHEVHIHTAVFRPLRGPIDIWQCVRVILTVHRDCSGDQ